MKLAAILSVLACGVTAAMWLRVSPVMGDTAFAPAVGLVVGSLICGLLLDRWSYKAALILGLAMLSVGLWRLVLGPSSHVTLILSAGVVTAGAGMTMVAANAVILPATVLRPGSALAVLNVVLPVGMLCNPVLSPAVISYAAATLASVSLACAVLMPMPPAAALETAPGKTAPGPAAIMLVFLLYGLFEGTIWNQLVKFFGAIAVLDRTDSWEVLSYGVPLGLMIGRIGSARILANVAPSAVLRIGGVAMAFAAGLLLLAHSPSACWLAAFCLGITMAPALPAVLALSFRALPRRPGLGLALVVAAGALGLAASVPLVALLRERFGLPMALLLLPAAALLIAAFSRKPAPAADTAP